MEGEALYAVKWYKDGHEFYRYVPRDSPPVQIFPREGINVDVSFFFLLSDDYDDEVEFFWASSFSLYSLQVQNSTNDQVVLDPIELASTGKYRCEVSAEAPSFQTVSDHGEMTVVGKFNKGDGKGKEGKAVRFNL